MQMALTAEDMTNLEELVDRVVKRRVDGRSPKSLSRGLTQLIDGSRK